MCRLASKSPAKARLSVRDEACCSNRQLTSLVHRVLAWLVTSQTLELCCLLSFGESSLALYNQTQVLSRQLGAPTWPDRKVHTFAQKTTNKKNLEVCASYPELSCSLILSEYSDKSRLVSLLGWLSGRRHIIQSMAAYCDKAILDIVLGALVCPMSQSTSVVLLHFSPSTVMLLTHLPLLSRCVLTQTNSPADLSPLRMCLKLQILILFTGEFIMQELSQHLTSLLLHNAGLHLKQECPCVMSLIKLELE